MPMIRAHEMWPLNPLLWPIAYMIAVGRDQAQADPWNKRLKERAADEMLAENIRKIREQRKTINDFP
jgi:hypothetical protein